MGIALPQLAPASEDRVSGGQVIKGALKFDDPGQTELRRTLGASTKFTLSFGINQPHLLVEMNSLLLLLQLVFTFIVILMVK